MTPRGINSLAPGRPGCHFETAIFNLVLLIGFFTSSKDNALRWMPRDLTDDKSTMAWCRQETSHYLSQCWPSSMSPYGVTRPQWVKKLGHQWFRKWLITWSVLSHNQNQCRLTANWTLRRKLQWNYVKTILFFSLMKNIWRCDGEMASKLFMSQC